MSAVLMYVSRENNQVLRVQHNIRIPPANVDEAYWIMQDTDGMPQEIVQSKQWNKLEFVYSKLAYKISFDGKVTDEILQINSVIDCIEKVQSMVNRMRFIKSPSTLYAYEQLTPLYEQEIRDYEEKGIIGELFKSRTLDGSSIEEAIAEYKIRQSSYKGILVMTEKILNEYIPKIKRNSDPYSVLTEMRDKFGPYMK